MEGAVQRLTTRNPTPIVLVLEAPHADGRLEYGLRLHLRRTLMILMSFSLTVFDIAWSLMSSGLHSDPHVVYATSDVAAVRLAQTGDDPV